MLAGRAELFLEALMNIFLFIFLGSVRFQLVEEVGFLLSKLPLPGMTWKYYTFSFASIFLRAIYDALLINQCEITPSVDHPDTLGNGQLQQCTILVAVITHQ